MDSTTVSIIVSIVTSFLAFLLAFWLYNWVKRQPSSNAKIEEISGYIRKGAATFLNKEYLVLFKF